jgi:PAS domain S-box-containing protein
MKSSSYEGSHNDESSSNNKSVSFLSRKLTSILLICGALIGSVFICRQYLHVRNRVLENLQLNAFNEVEQQGKNVDSWLAVLKAQVDMLAGADVVQSLDWQKVEPYFQSKLKRLEDFSVLSMARSDGWRYGTKGESTNIRDREYFQRAMAGEVNISDPLISRSEKELSISVAAPIWGFPNRNADPIGEVHGMVRIARLERLINKLKYGDNSYAFAVNTQGKVVLKSDFANTLKNPISNLFNPHHTQVPQIAKLILKGEQDIKKVKLDGKWKYIAYIPLQEVDWSLALVIPANNVEMPVLAIDAMALAVSFLTIGIILVTWRMQSFKHIKLNSLNQELESKVDLRTTDLQNTVIQLESEISNRKVVEVQLRESKKRLKTVISSAPVVISAIDKEGVFTFSDGQGLETLGLLPGQVVGASVYELYKDFPDVIENIKKALTGVETSYTACVGGYFFSTRFVPNYNESNELIGITGIALDVTQEKKAEREIQEREMRLQNINRLLPGVIYQYETNYKTSISRFSYLSHKSIDLFEIESESCIENADKIWAMIHPDDLPGVVKSTNYAIENNVAWSDEFRIITPSGKEKWLHGQSEPNINAPLGISQHNGLFTDITQRKAFQELLRQNQEFLTSIYDGVDYVLIVIDVRDPFEFRYSGWNNTAEILTGFTLENIYGKTPEEIFSKEVADDFRAWYIKCLTANSSITYEKSAIFQGEKVCFLATITPLMNSEGKIYRLVETSINISAQKQAENKLREQATVLETALQELKQTQAQLVQTEKMSSLGQLVAGVAHEINNPVSFIFGNLTHAQEYIQNMFTLIELYQKCYPNPKAEIKEELDNIEYDFLIDDLPKLFTSMHSGAKRIKDIVLSLRTFARLDEAEYKTVNIHESLDSTLLILQHRLKVKPKYSEINVIKCYGDLPLVECYAGQLNQVFLNILTNAIDAIDQDHDQKPSKEIIDNPGCITITTKIKDNHKIIISIKDNGIGINETNQSRIFDPFYTTKNIGQGTGLGLSVSYEIITVQHQGKIICISEPGLGSEFLIELPVNQSQRIL